MEIDKNNEIEVIKVQLDRTQQKLNLLYYYFKELKEEVEKLKSENQDTYYEIE